MMDQKTNKIIKKGDITNPSHRLNDKVMLSNITFYWFLKFFIRRR